MGKTKKSKWAHLPTVPNDRINTNNPDLELTEAKKKAEAYVTRNANQLYKVQTSKDTSAKAAKILKSEKKSEVEERIVNKLVKQLEKQKPVENTVSVPQKANKLSAPVFDVWDTPNIAMKTKPTLKSFENVTNKAVVLPESGLSYNPKLTSYEATIKKVVEDNVREIKPKSLELVKKRSKRKIEKRKQTAYKLKSSNLAGMNEHDKEILKQRDQMVKEKKLEALAENYEKEFDKTIREIANKQKKSEKFNKNKQKKAEDIRSGKLRTYNLRLSKHKLPAYVPPSLPLPEDMPENLRKIKTDASSNIRDQFESIYRRGLIEYKKIGKVQRRAKVKYHNKHSVKEDFYIDPE